MKTVKTRKTVIDFFDVDNPEHLEAWMQLEETGNWPKGFLKEAGEISFPNLWMIIIAFRLARTYCNRNIKKTS